MLRNMEWLKRGEVFPPECERARIERYAQNEALFNGEHFDNRGPSVYTRCSDRISRVIGNFDDIISFPVLLNYQRLMTLKMADLVCGEYPHISGINALENAAIQDVRDYSDFDEKLYQAVIDISRYGEAVQRVYLDANGQLTFTNWDPKEWFPIVSQDGTNTILKHCLCWRENRSTDWFNPDWYLHVQVHGTLPEDIGHYEHRVFKMGTIGGTIDVEVSNDLVPTGLDVCAVNQLRAFSTTSSVFGHDDYMIIDSLLAEIMTRIGQISVILDKHADPNITGPVTMLEQDAETGEMRLRTGKFYAVSAGEDQPQYMTWDGHLSSAFSQLELLINQLYILSEMGAALLGSTTGSQQAVSGAAMRFKMVNPIAKARRISNSLTRPVKRLFSVLSTHAEVSPDLKSKVKDAELKLPIPYSHVSVFWYDGLPDDPRENIEMAKLATGATKMMPLENAIMEYFGRTHEEALEWIERIKAETPDAGQEKDPNKPGPQDGTGVNPAKKGSSTGLGGSGYNNSSGSEDDE